MSRGPAFRVISVLTGALMLAMVLVTAAAVVSARPASATTTSGRICPGQTYHHEFFQTSDQTNLTLTIPAGVASVQFMGNATVLQTSYTGGTIDDNLVGVKNDAEAMNPSTSWNWTTGVFHTGDYQVAMFQQYSTSMRWDLTINLLDSGGHTVNQLTGSCTPIGSDATTGFPCPAQHAWGDQPKVADPVDTATGNLNEVYGDFSIVGRGPGLVLSHSYSSLSAGTSGPFGYGWTGSYSSTMSVDAGTGIATVRLGTGAAVHFYPNGSGGFEAPPFDVASLVAGTGGSYTYSQCNRTTMVFGSDGQLASITDRNGYTTTLNHDPITHLLSTVVDPQSSRQLTFTSSDGVHVTLVQDSSSPARSVQFGYDTSGNLTDYTDATGSAHWHYTYDSSHLLLTMQKPNQAGVPSPPLVVNTYDGQGRVLTQADGVDPQTVIDYTSIAGSTKVTDPKGNVTVYAYQNLLLSAVTKGWGTSSAATWIYVTDPYTLGVVQVWDPNNPPPDPNIPGSNPNSRATVAEYDVDGNMVSSTDVLGRTTTWTYNTFDEPLSMTDPNNVTTSYVYDTQGNLQSVSTPLAGTSTSRMTTYHHADASHPEDVTSVTDPAGQAWLNTYDPGTGERLTATDPANDVTKYGYNSLGWLTSRLSPRAPSTATVPCTPPAAGCTTSGYDSLGRVVLVTDANGHQTQTHYDADGNVDWTKDPNLKQTTNVYDAADQLTTVKRADTPQTTLGTHYWPDGLIKDTEDGAGNTTSYTYDPQGRLAATTVVNNTTSPASSQVTTYGYDPAGHQVSKADTGGTCPAWPISYPPSLSTSARCTVTQFDGAGEAIGVTYSDGHTPNVTSVVYDNDGRRTQMTESSAPTHPETWGWDSLGRLTSYTDTSPATVTYGYLNPNSTPDVRDPATTIVYPGTSPAQGTVTRGFDVAGRMTSVTDWRGHTTQFPPTPDSLIDHVAFPVASQSDTYGYDNAGALTSITDKVGTVTDASFAYTRDPANQVKNDTSTGTSDPAHNYNYNQLEQLCTQSATTGGSCAAPPSGATSYNYDQADNLTGAGVVHQQFDQAGQLCLTATVTTGSCAAPPAGATTYSYTEPGGLNRGNRTATTPPSGAATSYTWDQANRLSTVSPVAAQGGYVPATPARLMDTRSGSPVGTCVSPATCGTLITNGSPDELKVAGFGGVPATGVSAVVVNVTVLNASGYGFLTAWPGDKTEPNVSNVTYVPSTPISNTVIVPLSATGTIKLASAGGTTDVLVDLAGWYLAAGPAAGYTPLAGARILDTRTGSGIGICPGTTCARIPAGGTLKLQVAGQGGIPATGAAAAALNFTVVSPTGPGGLNGYSSDQPSPPAVTGLIWNTGTVLLSGLQVVKIGSDGAIQIYAAGATDVVVDVEGWYGPAATSGYNADPTPTRVLDTRAASRTTNCVGTCTTLIASPQTALTVHIAGLVSVPANATSVIATLTVVPPPSSGAGGVVAWPTGTAPNIATLDWTAGTPYLSNLVILDLASDGTIKLETIATNTDVTIDVQGWTLPGSSTATYTYNGDGLRTSKQINAGTPSHMTWDMTSSNLLEDGTNSYIYGPDGQVFEHVDSAGNTTWYHHDQLGSTRLLTNDTGAAVATTNYDPYGRIVAATGTPSPIGYAGQYTDPETGLIYLRARYYDPTTGQFMSRDPLAALTGSPYGYTNDNPLNGTDPTGLICFSLHCITNDVRGAATWVGDHPATAANLVAGAVCIVATAGVCGIAAATAAAVGVVSTTYDDVQSGKSLLGTLGDVGTNLVESAAVAIPGLADLGEAASEEEALADLLRAGLTRADAEAALSTPYWVTYGLKGPLALALASPDIHDLLASLMERRECSGSTV